MDAILNSLPTIGCTSIIFLSIIVCLVWKPETVKKVIAKMVPVIAVLALLIYGYGYANRNTEEVIPPFVSIIRATMDVLRIFVGSNNWDTIKTAYPDNYQQAVFWLLHLAALFISASAVITSLGSRLIRRIRLRLLWMWDLSVICGLNEQTLEFGKELAQQGVRSILYVDQNPDPVHVAAVDYLGFVLRADEEALEATPKFLRRVGVNPGKKKIHLYVLSQNTALNLQYAERFLRGMEKRGIQPENTILTLMGPESANAGRFLSSETQYGFGSVLSVNEPELVARMLVKTYPPCDVMAFDNLGRAKHDFHAVVIGFGRIGQSVLKQLVIQGQFCDSNCHLAVFSPHYHEKMGLLAYECNEMLKYYDISFHAGDGRSCEMYEYLSAHADTVNYIAVCTGNHLLNLEIAEQIRSFQKRNHNKAPIYMCSSHGVFYQDADNRLHAQKIYSPQILCSDQIDRMAMVLHHHYMGAGDMRHNWKNCSYFDRMSSRSAADFWYTILRAAGTTAEDAKENWVPRGDLLENLAKMEHLRWNAFHYAMGFRPMTEEEFRARAAQYQKEREKNPDTSYRIARDPVQRIHACMIPWEELDDYSRKENAITGQHKNYCENDRENIRAMRDVLLKMDAGK